MQRTSIFFGILFLAAGLLAPVQARPLEGFFKFLGYNVDEDRTQIRYEVEFGGIVELRIFTEEETMIYRNQYINRSGENVIYLKTRAFSPGTTYFIQLDYKQQTFRKEFRIP